MKVKILISCIFLVSQLFGQAKFKALNILNSSAKETNLSITPNGKYLFFMSDRGGQSWSTLRETDINGTKFYDGDIWYSEIKDGEWLAPRCLGANINTYEGEDEPNITADGQRVYYQSWRDDWANTGGPYYMAELDETIWSNSVGLGDEINRFFRELDVRTKLTLIKELKKKNLYVDYLELQQQQNDDWEFILKEKGLEKPDFWLATDGMAISPNEQIFIVSVYIPEVENYDLYISRKNEEGIWTYPKPLNHNSSADEKSIFIAGDNQTIYFASDKKGGNGGLDIYNATLLEGTNTTIPINLGSPYNTEKNEYGFIVNVSNESGFIISEGNILKMDFKGDAVPEETIIIDGMVVDQNDKPLLASIKLVNLTSKKRLGLSNSNGVSGEYSFSFLKENGQYQQLVSTQGISKTIPFEVTNDTKGQLNFVIRIDVPNILEKLEQANLEEGASFRVNQLHFKADKAIINKNSYPILKEIAKILFKRKKIKIEIGGHTNSLPTDEYCDKLSLGRAKAVYNYLIKNNISSDRLSYKGYGKRYPIESNETLVGRKQNQRVEITILENVE